jgi:hypothetical protein
MSRSRSFKSRQVGVGSLKSRVGVGAFVCRLHSPACRRLRTILSAHLRRYAGPPRQLWILAKYPDEAWPIIRKNLTPVQTGQADPFSLEPSSARHISHLTHAYIGYIFHNLTPTHNGRRRTLWRNTCGERAQMWRWTRGRTAAVCRTGHRYIPSAWLLSPPLQFGHSPDRAIQWILGHTVHYVQQARLKSPLLDCVDFMKRSRCKTYRRTRRLKTYCNYDICIQFVRSLHDARENCPSPRSTCVSPANDSLLTVTVQSVKYVYR